LARYMMFTQVYFQHTRRAYDHHIVQVLKHVLTKSERGLIPDGHFPPPTSKADIEQYLSWDDWRVLGLMQQGNAGEHGVIIAGRNHHRRVYQTSETPSLQEKEAAEQKFQKLSEFNPLYDLAQNSWYKFQSADIPVLKRNGNREEIESLSKLSSVVRELKSINQIRIYVPHAHKKAAVQTLNN